MANEKFDNDIPNIVLDKEDREAFQRTRAKEQGKTSPGQKNEPEPNAQGGGSSWLSVVSLIIALGACGGIYYMHQLSVQQDAQLQNATDRVSELERRLSATGEEMDQSAGAMRVKVSELSDKTDELWTQMDKLWASAWRKNQAEIKTLNETVGRQYRELDKKLGVLESDTGTVSTTLAVLQEQLSLQANTLDQLKASVATLQKNENDDKRQIGDVQAKIIAIEQINSAITRRVAELEKWKRSESTPTTP